VNTPLLSIVIPTHRRPAILRRTLEHIDKQTVRDRLEVIVVSDGVDEETEGVVRSQKTEGSFALKFEEIPKSHQGVARNRGVAMARGDYVLFIGDDIFLQPDACENHLKIRAQFCHTDPQSCHPELVEGSANGYAAGLRQAQPDNIATLGFTTWDPALQITPIMRWLEASGWQFGYPMIERYKHGFVPFELQHRFTYTSHISLPLRIAKAHPFREDVSLYGWEDVEWGMRLAKAGVRLLYEPDAKALHHHPMTLEQSLRRMETLGESAVHLARLVPELDRLPRGWKRLAYRLFALLPTMRGRHAGAFVRGMNRLPSHQESV
jgi:glycosyltransferase involved in cell wall biosynthesis